MKDLQALVSFSNSRYRSWCEMRDNPELLWTLHYSFDFVSYHNFMVVQILERLLQLFFDKRALSKHSVAAQSLYHMLFHYRDNRVNSLSSNR